MQISRKWNDDAVITIHRYEILQELMQRRATASTTSNNAPKPLVCCASSGVVCAHRPSERAAAFNFDVVTEASIARYPVLFDYTLSCRLACPCSCRLTAPTQERRRLAGITFSIATLSPCRMRASVACYFDSIETDNTVCPRMQFDTAVRHRNWAAFGTDRWQAAVSISKTQATSVL